MLSYLGNYAAAESYFAGRVNKHLGRKISTYWWMSHDAARDCFVLSEVRSKYGNDGKYLHDRSQWRMEPAVEIYPDRICVLRHVTNAILSVLNLSAYRLPGANTKGFAWNWRGVSVKGNAPVTLNMSGGITAAPCEVLETKADRLKDFNTKIRVLRNQLRARTRMGAFANVDVPELSRAEFNRQRPYRWEMTPRDWVNTIMAVNIGDITSFHKLLWLCFSYRGNYPRPRAEDWVGNFNRAIAANRKSMQIAYGAAKFVATST